jgi:hypothetical protein
MIILSVLDMYAILLFTHGGRLVYTGGLMVIKSLEAELSLLGPHRSTL